MIRAWLACVVVLVACDRGDTSQWGKTAAGSATATEAVAPPEAKVAPPAPEPPATFRYGDKVSAQWTNGKWYRGTLTAVYSDGTADVRYDDGDRSKGLPFEKIKLIKRPLFEVEVPAKRN